MVIQYGVCALYAAYLRLQALAQNTYCVSIATMVTGTRLNVALCVCCLACPVFCTEVFGYSNHTRQSMPITLLDSRQLNFLNVNYNGSKNEAYGMSCFNTLKAEEKLSIWLNFVLGRLYSYEILITLRWRS